MFVGGHAIHRPGDEVHVIYANPDPPMTKALSVMSASPAIKCTVVCLAVKTVGEPDAVAPRVRFDEQGWETE
jgi:hypothetical protein